MSLNAVMKLALMMTKFGALLAMLFGSYSKLKVHSASMATTASYTKIKSNPIILD